MSLRPALPEECLGEFGLRVGIGDRAEQAADEREECVTVAGADLRECRARAGARE